MQRDAAAGTEPGCDYCGLPLGAAGAPGPRYCCFGCRFAAGITGAHGDDAVARWMMVRLGVAVFFSMNVMVFTMLLWSQPEGPMEPAAAALYGLARHACLLFTVPVLVLLGGPLVEAATDEVCRRRPGINLLLAVGVAAAFALSARATWLGSGHVFFEVACMVLVALTLGRWLEATGKLRTTAALRELQALLPDHVHRLGAAPQATTDVPLATVVPGDRLQIRPGEQVPTDGIIERGHGSLDERLVTGEPLPAERGPGDRVHSGTTNLDGDLVVRVTAAAGAGTLERLIATVIAAAAGGRRQRVAARLAGWFLPLVLVVALGALAVHGRRSGLAAGVTSALAVAVVACPCALGLATPLALWAALGRAARRQVLVRDADAFTALAGVDLICFDKTGTLTRGCRLAAVIEPDGAGGTDGTCALGVAAALAGGSTHPLSAALVEAAAARGVAAAHVVDCRTTAGRGIAGRLPDGRAGHLGSHRWLEEQGVVVAGLPPADCLLAVGGRVAAGFRFAETLHDGAAAAVTALADRGIDSLVLSGDREERVAVAVGPLGIPHRASLLPEEKLAALAALRGAGHRVVMVGDGLNDAPALAAADVGVALGCGADVSRWTAAVCLLDDDLARLPWVVDLARATERTIRWNLLHAFAYNAAALPLAATGAVHPAVAAAAMALSSLFVVGGSLRLATGSDEPLHGGEPGGSMPRDTDAAPAPPVPRDPGATAEDLATGAVPACEVPA